MLWHLSRETHAKPAHHEKVSNVTIAHPDISKSQNSHHSDVSAKISKPQHDPPDNPLGVVPKPAIDPIRAQQVERKARAPHLFRFLWELNKCLINKKVGWLWKIAICLILEMLSLWNSGSLFEKFGGFYVPPCSSTKEYLQKQRVPFLCWLFGGYIYIYNYIKRSFLKEVRLHKAAILGSGMGLFISLA